MELNNCLKELYISNQKFNITVDYLTESWNLNCLFWSEIKMPQKYYFLNKKFSFEKSLLRLCVSFWWPWKRQAWGVDWQFFHSWWNKYHPSKNNKQYYGVSNDTGYEIGNIVCVPQLSDCLLNTVDDLLLLRPTMGRDVHADDCWSAHPAAKDCAASNAWWISIFQILNKWIIMIISSISN